jgi:hypothetical protein
MPTLISKICNGTSLTMFRPSIHSGRMLSVTECIRTVLSDVETQSRFSGCAEPCPSTRSLCSLAQGYGEQVTSKARNASNRALRRAHFVRLLRAMVSKAALAAASNRGAESGNRTHMILLSPVFETGASANSAISALDH